MTPEGTASSSNTMLWGNPALLVQVTESPLEMVTVAGSNTRPPESLPSLTAPPACAENATASDAPVATAT